MSGTPLELGQPAPEFRLKGPGGQFITLSEYRGKKHVVLVFFPLAFSPVCSHQLPMVERDVARFEDLDAVVMGASIDSHYANEAFARSLGLSFPLLSDFKRQAMSAYGVLLSEAGYSGRATFVIDKQGQLAYRDIAGYPVDLTLIPDNERILKALEAMR